MSAQPVDVLAVMQSDAHCAEESRIRHYGAEHGVALRHNSDAAHAAVRELILAAQNALGDLTTAGTPRPIKGKERTHAMLAAALAACGGVK